jgi:hypothetical protein
MDTLIKLAGEYGLGVALSCGIFTVMFWLLRRAMKAFEETLALFREQLSVKDTLLGNHINHLTAESNAQKTEIAKQGIRIESLGRQMDKVGDRIVEAIENQSELMKALWQKQQE